MIGWDDRANSVSITSKSKVNRYSMVMGTSLAVLCGLALWWLPLGARWVNASYDLPSLFGGPMVSDEVMIVGMDDAALSHMGIPHGPWPWSVHAQLLDRLREDQARLVVFDGTFNQTNASSEDQALTEALRRFPRVILPAIRVPNSDPQYPGEHTERPTRFLTVAPHWGIAAANPEIDGTIRRIFTGVNEQPGLAWKAAELFGAKLPSLDVANRLTYWLRYYGPAGTIPYRSYYLATNQPAGSFKDKVVFIGGKPSLLYLGETADVRPTPFTPWDGQKMAGVEVVATMFLNLVHHHWLRRLPAWGEFGLLLIAGFLFGGGLSRVQPLRAAGWALGGMALVMIAGFASFWLAGVWWSWAVIAAGQIPCALGWSVLYRTHTLSQQVKQALPASVPGSLPSATEILRPEIPEHTLERRIGEGAYGEVWLARDVVGSYHAVKVVYAARFGGAAEPFEREYHGISTYSPISLSHPGLLHVLLVGRRQQQGYFYCVMELADDATGGLSMQSKTYVPRTLDRDLELRRYLPAPECIGLALQLTAALEHLHRHGLIHRDIKPSNIVFVKGVPKLADIGLVTNIASTMHEVSFVGTEGYIAPEGPGAPSTDIFSLGIVLYRMSTGLAAKQFPTLPDLFSNRPDQGLFLQLHEIVLKACAKNPALRYPSAAAMHDALLELKRQIRPPTPDTVLM